MILEIDARNLYHIFMDLSQYVTEIVAACVSVLSALSALLVCVLQNKKKKAELETAKTEYQTALLRGAFVLCPKCGQKIFAKDCVWQFDSVLVDSNEEGKE